MPEENENTPPENKAGGKTYDEAYVAGLRREAQSYRERLAAVEGEFTAFRDKAGKDAEAATLKLKEANDKSSGVLKDAALRIAAKDAGLRDLDALKLFDASAVTVSDDGTVTIPKSFFDDAKKAKGYLFEQSGVESGNTSNTGKAPPARGNAPVDVRTLNEDEYKAARAAAIAQAR